jgi:membrane protein YqaA with SNARE-associated domain
MVAVLSYIVFLYLMALCAILALLGCIVGLIINYFVYVIGAFFPRRKKQKKKDLQDWFSKALEEKVKNL